jgi:hypothetical protein
MRAVLVVWMVYVLIDFATLAAYGPTLRAGAFVAVSIVTKAASACLGAVAANWRA